MTEAPEIAQQTQLLIEGCIKGDRFSQTRLYNLFNQKMFAVCLRYAKSREEGEEILQEGMARHEISSRVPASRSALLLLSTLQGASLVAWALKDPTVIKPALKQAVEGLTK